MTFLMRMPTKNNLSNYLLYFCSGYFMINGVLFIIASLYAGFATTIGGLVSPILAILMALTVNLMLFVIPVRKKKPIMLFIGAVITAEYFIVSMVVIICVATVFLPKYQDPDDEEEVQKKYYVTLVIVKFTFDAIVSLSATCLAVRQGLAIRRRQHELAHDPTITDDYTKE